MNRMSLSVLFVFVLFLPSSAQEKAIQTRTDEGELVIKKEGPSPLSWQWYLKTKDYTWLLGMPAEPQVGGPLTKEALRAKGWHGKQVKVTSRAGFFGLGNQKSLLVLKIELKPTKGK